MMQATSRAEVTLEWADGEYLFALKGKQIEELQVCCKAGFGAVYRRTMEGNWFFSDIYHTIRLALIGGGLGAIEAKRMCDNYVDGVVLASGPNSPLIVAQSILGASVMGLKPKTEKPTPLSMMAGSTSGITEQLSSTMASILAR